jgi:cysteine protease ATG4
MLVVVARLGVQQPNPEYKPMFNEIIGLKQSIGLIGGKPGKALYLIGMDGNEYIYLDPHYVQPSSNRKNMESLMRTYFCDSYRTIKYESLDPSVGLGFYIGGIGDLQDFIMDMETLRKKFGKDFFIYT